jgi:hypothetical protein
MPALTDLRREVSTLAVVGSTPTVGTVLVVRWYTG